MEEDLSDRPRKRARRKKVDLNENPDAARQYLCDPGPLLPVEDRNLEHSVAGFVNAARQASIDYQLDISHFYMYDFLHALRVHLPAPLDLLATSYASCDRYYSEVPRKRSRKDGASIPMIKVLHQTIDGCAKDKHGMDIPYLFAAIDSTTGDIFMPTNALARTCDRKRCGPPRGNIFSRDFGARCIDHDKLIRKGQRQCPACSTSTSGYWRHGTFHGICTKCNAAFSCASNLCVE